MGIKAVLLKQYRDKVNQTVKQFRSISQPLSEGWLKTVHQALGMSGPQLAKRLGMTKGRISQAEAAEVEGAVTLKQLKS